MDANEAAVSGGDPTPLTSGRPCRCRSRRLRLVVVESHQQALPHIHRALRQRRPTPPNVPEAWTLVHWDSHADLACPTNLPAQLCWRPYPPDKEEEEEEQLEASAMGAGSDHDFDDDDDDDRLKWSLYDHLEATASGIAEWILPLVLGANCTGVRWVRPPPPPSPRRRPVSLPSSESAGPLHQRHSVRNASFYVGDHTFRVGAWVGPTPPLPTPFDDDDDDHDVEAVLNATGEASSTGGASSFPTSAPSSLSFLDVPHRARIRVDSHAPYYADDDDEGDDDERSKKDGAPARGLESHAPTHELLCAQTVHLEVSYGGDEDNDNEDDGGAGATGTGPHPLMANDHAIHTHEDDNEDDDNINSDNVNVNQDWVLDVCLDYFWCDNPFWTDLHRMNARFADALEWLVTQSVLYEGDTVVDSQGRWGAGCSTENSFVKRRSRVLRFRRLLGRYLRHAAVSLATNPSVPPTSSPPSTAAALANPIEAEIFQSLLSFYPQMLVPNAREAMREVRTGLAALPDAADREAVVREGLQAIPYLTLPRDEGDPRPVIEARLRRFRRWLHYRSPSSPCPGRRLACCPMLITVARSAQDGYLPLELVEEIQGRVIELLHERYCACPKRRVGLGRKDGDRQLHVGTRHDEALPLHQCTTSAVDDPSCTLEVVLDYEYDPSGDEEEE